MKKSKVRLQIFHLVFLSLTLIFISCSDRILFKAKQPSNGKVMNTLPKFLEGTFILDFTSINETAREAYDSLELRFGIKEENYLSVSCKSTRKEFRENSRGTFDGTECANIDLEKNVLFIEDGYSLATGNLFDAELREVGENEICFNILALVEENGEKWYLVVLELMENNDIRMKFSTTDFLKNWYTNRSIGNLSDCSVEMYGDVLFIDPKETEFDSILESNIMGEAILRRIR